MVLDISKIFAKKSDKAIQQPMLNEVWFSVSNNRVRNYFSGFDYKKFWRWFRSRPELYAVIQIPITDTVGGPVEFVSPDGKPLGRNKLLEAKRFWHKNYVRETLKSIEWDRYVTGDAYGLKQKLSKNQVRRKMLMLRKESLRMARDSQLNVGMKEDLLADYLFNKAIIDEDFTAPKNFTYLASSTVEIEADRHEVKGYIQRVGGNEQRYSPKEVIHLVLNRLDGKVSGYSPIESLTAEIFLIQMIKENMIAFFENGGSPSKIYSLPDVKSVKDPQYRRIIDLLRESKKVINSNGSLVYAGKLQVDDLGSSPKDMEYKDLAMWIVSNIAFAFQIPSTRIPFLLSGSGGAVNKGDSGGVADAGYWRMIETQQDYLEDIYNSQLFEELGFHIKFVRGNKQDKIRDTQAMVQLFDGVAKVQEILKRQGKKLSDDKLLRMINFAEDDVEKISDKDLELFSDNPMDRQNQLNSMQTLRNEATVDRSNNKRESATVKKEKKVKKFDPDKVRQELADKELEIMMRKKENELLQKKLEFIEDIRKEFKE